MIIKFLKKIRQRYALRNHLISLEKNCVMGKDFNAAPWQKPTGLQDFSVGNLTGNRNSIVVGDYCNLNAMIHCNSRGKVIIGNHVFMNAKTTIRCDHEIRVGNYCMFGPNVRLWDTNNHPMSASARERQAKEICNKTVDSYEAGGGPIFIEDNVWLCIDVIVLAGVCIGHGSVVAAGSIVTKDIPPMTFAAGIPAKPIGKIPE